MPTYSYVCPTCGCATEQYRLIADRNDTVECPVCGTALKRRIEPTLGLWHNNSRPKDQEMSDDRFIPNVTFSNCTMHGGSGFLKMNGDLNARVENLTALGANRVFEMRNGARVDAANVIQRTSNKTTASRKQRKKRKRKR